MAKERSILLTTLGYTKDHLQTEYYMCRRADGEALFCTGISGAEAGTKYLLSQAEIDEIVVLCPMSAMGRIAAGKSYPLQEWILEDRASIAGCSEGEFYCYRIAQYLNRLDIEANDILYYATPQKRDELRALMRRKLKRGRDGQFYEAATNPEAADCFYAVRKTLADKREVRWLKHMMYQDMDSSLKMRARHSNEDVVVRFIPLEKNERGTFSVSGMVDVVNRLAARAKNGLSIHVDMQGMDKADSYTMWTMLSMVHDPEVRFSVDSIIQTRRIPSSFLHAIDDEILRYDVEILLAGIRAFLQYGKAELLEEYVRSHGIEDPEIHALLHAMHYVDTGVSLCNMEDLKYGIRTLKRQLGERRADTRQAADEALFSILRRSILQDYGVLLTGEDIHLPEMIGWALRKHFYQQALTMIESLIPADMVRRGICYYAKSRADLAEVYARWNVLYWNEIPKCRYGFNDLDHFFIKNYGRSVINNRQAKDRVSRDLARTLVDQQRGACSELCTVYSDLGNDDMLYELLLSYYNVSNLRNRVSHANAAEIAVQSGAPLRETDSFALLKYEMERFLNLYRAACKRIERQGPEKQEIVLADSASFRAYTASHRMQPIGGEQDLLENVYHCQYNGKELAVTVRMFDTFFEEDAVEGD